MDHSYYRDKISAFFDGALEAQERELISRHLSGCEECRALLKRIGDFSRRVDEMSGLAGDEYFEKLALKIESRIASPVEKVVDVRELRWKSFWWKVSAAAASVLLVVTIAYYQLEDEGDIRSRITERSSKQEMSSAVNADSTLAKDLLESGRVDLKNEGYEKDLDGTVIDGEKAAKRKEIPDKPEEVEKEDLQSAPIGQSKESFNENVPAAPTEPAQVADEVKVAGERDDFSSESKVQGEVSEIVRFDLVQKNSLLQTEAQNTLAGWRAQRDSIQVLLGFERDTVQILALNTLNELSAPTANGFAKTRDSIQVYQQLANSWYQIGLQTTDSTEKDRAIQFLNWYKGKFPSDSQTVNQQLQQLPR